METEAQTNPPASLKASKGFEIVAVHPKVKKVGSITVQTDKSVAQSQSTQTVNNDSQIQKVVASESIQPSFK